MANEARAGEVEERDVAFGHCRSYHAAIELIGRRWNGVILQRLLGGPLRFSEIRRDIPRLTDAMLSQRLRELEDAGIVERAVTDDRPVQITYGLTPVGQRLSPVLNAVAEWSDEWARR
ncbi:MAG: helix-turn-helix transcriptional regulator [Cellulomonas sp.]|jgi:DNA-binding HxlR family transcriptional regulator|uniref:winged helix-turn-helix transcriptional regulator n=1 Tax=Cellulomonas sp. TaxID=40001 RepID=UPI0019DE02D0|nr:helix-turn-helix domain-containing protein [Cellulomonas sp.]MBF0687510.1 helix-turn-helix transcriptional regulator [Cellulomonas sp.]